MGRQASRGADAEADTTSVHSHQALHRSPNRTVHSRERLPSGLLKDFRVVGEDAASKRAHLSDDISASNDSPDGGNLSDKHEGTMAALPSVPSICALTSLPFGSDDEREPSLPVTLTRPEKSPSPGSSRLMKAENSPAEHTDSREVAHQPPVMEDWGGGGLGHFTPQTTFGKEAQDIPGVRCHSSLILQYLFYRLFYLNIQCVPIQVDAEASAHQAPTCFCRRAVLVTCPFR